MQQESQYKGLVWLFENKAFKSLAMNLLQLPVLMMLISGVITLLSLWEWKGENKSSDMESFFLFF